MNSRFTILRKFHIYQQIKTAAFEKKKFEIFD